LVAALFSAAATAGAAFAKERPFPKPGTVTCAYVEAGAAGPADNYLAVTVHDFEVGLIQRMNDRLVVSGALGSELSCGTQPTVSNIDRIEVQADQDSLGAVASTYALLGGATPEADGTGEIEMTLVQPGGIPAVWGTGGADQIVAGTLVGGGSGININANEASPDVDVVASGFGAIMSGFDGPDLLSGAGGPGFAGPVAGFGGITGGGGDDEILGGAGKDDIEAGRGEDTVYADGGADFVTDGPGRDQVDGGPGADALYSQRSGRDRLLCGAGRDRVAVGRGDRIHRCETVERHRVSDLTFQFKLPPFLGI
jgi:hypothetical protein